MSLIWNWTALAALAFSLLANLVAWWLPSNLLAAFGRRDWPLRR